MAQNSGINLPGGFGGLVRYNEEYDSLINLKPSHVILFIILIIGVRIALPIIFS